VTTAQETDERRRLERAREIALFRYSLVQEVISPHLTAAQRGRRVRQLAAMTHPGPGGAHVRVSYQTINRWKRDYLAGGFEALVPSPRQASPRTPGEVLELAAALKRENPERTAAQVQRILQRTAGWAPSDRTLQRLFARLELSHPAGEDSQLAFGRFEALRPNELWTGDALHGPQVGGRKAFLFCFIDDHSRAVMGARWAFHEDVVRLAAALRPALAVRGVPEHVYVDNGSAFVDAWLLRACAVLGIKLVHSRPGRPQGRGKVERFFRTVREQFLVEIAGSGRQAGTQAADLAELNRLFDAWVQAGYHRAVHSETGEPPLARWAKGIPRPLPLPSPAQLREAFLWSERRTVKKTATVSLHGNLYQVDPSLVRCVVELVFDPFDLTDIQVRHKGQPAGKAVPFVIGRHRHAKTRTADGQHRAEPEPTGIDYLRMLDAAHGTELQAQINYAALITPAENGISSGAGSPCPPGTDAPSQQEDDSRG
jgi:putative transposase